MMAMNKDYKFTLKRVINKVEDREIKTPSILAYHKNQLIGFAKTTRYSKGVLELKISIMNFYDAVFFYGLLKKLIFEIENQTKNFGYSKLIFIEKEGLINFKISNYLKGLDYIENDHSFEIDVTKDNIFCVRN